MTALLKSATAAHVLPFAVFLLLNGLTAWLRIENSELPWHQRAPEHWLYPLQTLLCGALLIAYRRHYRLAPWRGLSLALSLGIVGIVLWITPIGLQGWFDATGRPVPALLQSLGVLPRTGGFDPTVLAAWPGWEAAAIGMRFLRLVVVVPLIEEIFWRGFLMRYLTTDEGPWQKMPFGAHRWLSFWIVTLLVMLAHQPQDYAAAFIWGALVYFVAVRTKSLAACVLMHASANLLLGLYIMRSHSWGLW
jgi:CAAX prenyl protease-like protein